MKCKYDYPLFSNNNQRRAPEQSPYATVEIIRPNNIPQFTPRPAGPKEDEEVAYATISSLQGSPGDLI